MFEMTKKEVIITRDGKEIGRVQMTKGRWAPMVPSLRIGKDEDLVLQVHTIEPGAHELVLGGTMFEKRKRGNAACFFNKVRPLMKKNAIKKLLGNPETVYLRVLGIRKVRVKEAKKK